MGLWFDILLSLVLLGVIGLGVRDKNYLAVAVGLVCGYVEVAAAAYLWSGGATRFPGFRELVELWHWFPLVIVTAVPAAAWASSRLRRAKDDRRESDEVLILVAIVAAVAWLIGFVIGLVTV
jgi:hypothetical protein